MKVLTSKQVREVDQFTIQNEPIASIDLMERASNAFVTKFLGLHPEKKPVLIFCGTGNNGGDGLAIARILSEKKWQVEVFVVGDEDSGSPDFKTNLGKTDTFRVIKSADDFPSISKDCVLIDAIFGSGLSRPIKGIQEDLIQYINTVPNQKTAVDIASGLYSDQAVEANVTVFEVDYTISFQLPKLAFFLPSNEKFVGQWRVVDIGLGQEAIESQLTDFYLTEAKALKRHVPSRSIFTHKNKVGRLMIVSGSKGKLGAATLCTRAAFKAGAGLINVHVPSCGLDVLQVSIPEAMVSLDSGKDNIEQVPETADTIAIGPGLGTAIETVKAFKRLLETHKKPMVVDADGINILAQEQELLGLLPEESILTPHPGEFKRLVGSWADDFEKLDKLRSFCVKHKLNLVLKGAFSAVCDVNGVVRFNPSGNPALATAGSGDVLTGIVAALLAQGLEPEIALRLGVYIHGLAGDMAILNLEAPWIQASDIVDHIHKAFASLINK